MYLSKQITISSLASICLIVAISLFSIQRALARYDTESNILKEFENHVLSAYGYDFVEESTVEDTRKDLDQLKNLIRTKKGVLCSSQYIDSLSKYHNERIINRNEASPINKMEKFFVLYAKQVAFTCKKLILVRLNLAQLDGDNKDIVRALDRIFELHVSNPLYDRHYRGQYNVASNIESIIYLDDIMKEDSYNFKGVEFSRGAMMKLDKLRGDCLLLQPHYTNTIIPVARLASLGYNVKDRRIDSQLQESASTIERWLIATATCQMVNKIKVTIQQTEANAKFKVNLTLERNLLHETVNHNLYQDDFDKFDDNVLDSVKKKNDSSTLEKLRELVSCCGGRRQLVDDFSDEFSICTDGDCINVITTTIKAIIGALHRNE